MRKNEKRETQVLSFVDNERIYWAGSEVSTEDFFAREEDTVEVVETQVVEPETEEKDTTEVRAPRFNVEEEFITQTQETEREREEDVEREEVERERIRESGERYEIVKTGTHLLELLPGNYIIVGAFQYFDNAVKYSDQLYDIGQRVKYGYNTQRGLWHVYIYKSDTLAGIRERLAEVRQVPQLQDAWLLTVE